MTDDSLVLTVRQAQSGDTRAFDCLVRRFQNMAVAYARNILRNPGAAEDAAQDAFVQAWSDLPRLKEPAVFSSWLRRIVFKYCDRYLRSAHPTLPLDEDLLFPRELGPEALVDRADDVAVVRAAIDALPYSLREITLMYYLSGHDTKEIGDFLEIPLSTVKNRLYASRKKLKEELWMMSETTLENDRPSNTEAFAERVLARVLKEFQRQEADSPHKADLGLLVEGQTALFQLLHQNSPLDDQDVRDGFRLLWRKKDWQSVSTLLMHYISKPRTDFEMAWAYLHLVTAIAATGSAAGAVLTYDTFERWVPGKFPVVSCEWTYFPSDGNDTGSTFSREDLRLLFLAVYTGVPALYWDLNVGRNSESIEYIRSFLKAWYNSDYLAKVDAVLAEIPLEESSYNLRFQVLQQAANACACVDDRAEIDRYIQQMYRLAEACADASERSQWEAKVLGHEVHLARRRKDAAAFEKKAVKLIALLDDSSMTEGNDTCWIRHQRQALAFVLMRGDRHDLAIKLWEANEASGGQINGYGGISHAATIWKMTAKNVRTIAALKKARAQEGRDVDMVPMFKACSEFAGVLDNPAFLKAIS